MAETAPATAEWTEGTFDLDWYTDGVRGKKTVTGVTWAHWGIHTDAPGRWWVTHLPSGAEVGLFGNEQNARGYAAEIEPLTDWDVVTADGPPKPVGTKVKKLRTQWGGK